MSEGWIQMDPETVKAVAEWPIPKNRKQRFLGFANFYKKFVQNFGTVAAPWHKLTSPKNRFSLADQAFKKLRLAFTTASVLVLPDPHWQFAVEVDTSNIRVGAILSQRPVKDNKLHPCAFLFHKTV